MTELGYDRRRAELGTQTALLRSCVEGADLAAPVPTCPGWNLAQLLRHVGGAHHWAESVVRTRSTSPVPDDLVNDVAGYADAGADVLDAWVAEGAARLADALRDAGPTVPVWTPGPGGTPAFWARRMLFETVVHRADASWAVGTEFAVADEVALDGVAEWMGFGTVPEVIEPQPGLPPLLGPGRTLRFRGIGTAPGAAAEWLVDLTGDAVVVRRVDGTADEGSDEGSDEGPDGSPPSSATVSVRAPLADLLLLLYRRRSAADASVEVHGDEGLLDLWLERAGFWLRE